MCLNCRWYFVNSLVFFRWFNWRGLSVSLSAWTLPDIDVVLNVPFECRLEQNRLCFASCILVVTGVSHVNGHTVVYYNVEQSVMKSFQGSPASRISPRFSPD